MRLAGLRPLAFVVLFVACLSPSRLGGQDTMERQVAGRVVDPDGSPISGAEVGVLGTEIRVITSSDGRFLLRTPEATEIRLRVSAMGYRHAERVVTGGTDVQLVVLERAPHELPTVTVTGATARETTRIPGAATIIGSAVLHERAPLSVMDALRSVPGIHTADEDPYGLNLNVGFRGLPPRRSSRTLLLEDGVPILLGPYSDPSMHYAPPIEALERVEIVKGSAQIENGPQTVGGVLNFVTRRPPHDGTRAEITAGAGALDFRNLHLHAGTGRAGYGLALDLTHREGEGVRREQGHRVLNAVLSGHLPLGAAGGLLVKGAIWNEASRISETGLTRSEFEDDPFSLPFAAAGRFDVRRYLGQVIHERAAGRLRLLTNAYLSSTERTSWRQSGESEERLGEADYAEDFNCVAGAASYEECGNQGRPRDYLVGGIEPRLSITLGADDDDPGTLDLGLRLYGERVRRRQFVGNRPDSRQDDAAITRDNELRTRVLAGFARLRFAAGPITLSPGIRVEQLWQEIRNRYPGSEAEADQAYAQILPGVGVSWSPGGGATLFGGVHRGFAPPRPADVYRPEPGQPVALVDPETSWNWEVGGRVAPAPGLEGAATLFQMDFGNQIVEAPAAAGQRFVNGGRTLHRGLELSGSASLGTHLRTRDDLSLRAAYTFLPVARFGRNAHDEGETTGNRLPYAPRHTASLSVAFAHRTGITFGGALEHTGRQFADDENTVEPSEDGQVGILPAYTVTNAFVTYSVPASRIQLRLSVRNLTDEVYITQRNEGIYTGMRRLARGEIRWSF